MDHLINVSKGFLFVFFNCFLDVALDFVADDSTTI